MTASDLHITSLQNPKIKQALSLRDRSEREKTVQCLIEGYREILRAVEANFQLNQLFYCPELFLGENEPALIQAIKAKGAAAYSCEPNVFKKISYRDRPDGLLAIGMQQRLSLKDLENTILKPEKPPFLVIAESIEKPGNLGTILRSSDAVGADALIVCDKCTDLYNPNVVRASVGTLFTVPTAEAGSRECLDWLKQQGIAILAATPAAVHEYTEVDLTKPVAIALGTEQYGLSNVWMKHADLQVKIPMCGAADSLNVAMATTVLLYEVLRQRRSQGKAP